MPSQANLLVERMTRALGAAKFAADWKLVTFFIGGNDLCGYCKDVVRLARFLILSIFTSIGIVGPIQPYNLYE